MRPTWNWLLAASLTYIAWRHCDAHTTRDTLCLDCRCWLLVFHLFIQPHRRALVKMLGSPIDPFDSHLLVCLTLPCRPLFTFISLPRLTALCVWVCVCVSNQSLLFTRWNAPWHCDSCVELVSYEQSLTWNAILETHTRSDSSKTFPLLFHCVTEDEGGNNWGSRHKEKTCIPYSLWFKFHFDI